MSETTVRLPADDAELEALGTILRQCFQFPVDDWGAYRERAGREEFRVAIEGGRVAGGCALLPTDQSFGGRLVPAVGIAAVGIAPEARGGGVATALMTSVVREARERGLPLSPLWPSTQGLYRRAGWEAAGDRLWLKIDPAKIGLRDREPAARRIADPTSGRLAAIREAWVRDRPGALTRNAVIWYEVLLVREASLFAYEIGPESAPEGYAVFVQKRGADGMELRLHDAVARTPGALRRIWSLFAAHSSVVRQLHWVTWPGGPELLLLPEQRWSATGHDRWMLRITDPAAALEARGWPRGCEATLGLVVEDPILGDTSRLRLEVAGGEATVRRDATGDGGVHLDVLSLAPLYSGHTTARELRDWGRLDGDDAAVAVADRIFAGPAPCMIDPF